MFAGSVATLEWGPAPAGAAGGLNTQIQYNNSGTLAGITGITSGGTTLDFADSVNLRMGSDNDFSMQHNGTNQIVSNTTGDFIFDNTGTTAEPAILRVNSDGRK